MLFAWSILGAFQEKRGMDMSDISREEAFALLKKYNQDPFHIQHALTVEAVMIRCIRM